MMNNKKQIWGYVIKFFFSFFLLLGLKAFAFSSPGEDGFQFLDIGPGPRQSAMGESAVAVADDVNAGFWNPAAYGEVRRNEVSLLYNTHLESTSYSGVHFVHPFSKKGAISLQMMMFDYGNFDEFDSSGLKTGSFGAEDLLASIGYGRRVGQSIVLGAQLKHVEEKLADVKAQALAADIGILYLPFLKGWLSNFRFGAAYRNLGSGGTFDSDKVPLPKNFSLGVAYRGFSESIILSLDLEREQDDKTAINFGQELWLKNLVAVRAGFQNGDDITKSLNFGFGFRFKDLQIDYAFIPQGKDFDSVHRVGFVFRFGGQAEKIYQEGLNLSQKGNHAEAILKYKKVLDIHPGHQKSIRRMKEAALKLREENKTSDQSDQ